MTDTEILGFLLENDCLFDGLLGVEMDRYEYALLVAEERGREEPTLDDSVEGLRRMVREAQRLWAVK